MQDLQALGDELHIHQPARRVLQIPRVIAAQFLAHERAHVAHILQRGFRIAWRAKGCADGGGSNTDLTAFDDYELAKTIADCPKPVLTGIGHDRNISVADVVGHTMLKTPTRCAASITEHNMAFLSWIQDGQTRIGHAAARFFETGKQQAQDAARRLKTAASWRLESEKNKLLQAEKHLEMLHPLKTLEIGFALISKNGHIVTSRKQVSENDSIEIRFSDGYSHALITKNDN